VNEVNCRDKANQEFVDSGTGDGCLIAAYLPADSVSLENMSLKLNEFGYKRAGD
jgi:hypothetical protein